MLQIIHIIVTLIAALAVTIMCLYQDVTFYIMCIRLVVIIPIFFILGLLFRSYLIKLFAPLPEEEAEGNEALNELEDMDESADIKNTPGEFNDDYIS